MTEVQQIGLIPLDKEKEITDTHVTWQTQIEVNTELSAILQSYGQENVFKLSIVSEDNQELLSDQNSNEIVPFTKDGAECSVPHIQTLKTELLSTDYYKLVDVQVHAIKLEDLLSHPCAKGTTAFAKDIVTDLLQKEKSLKSENFQCETCEASFYKLILLKLHSEKCYLPRVRVKKGYSTCSYCKKNVDKRQLREHVASHTGEKLFQCNICNRGFHWEGNLKCHMILHSDDRPFVCEVCGMSFKRKVTLKKHNILHYEERKFKCQTCGKLFSNKQTLKFHLEEHFESGTVYECKLCEGNKVFKTKRKLEYHNKCIHSFRYSCNECGEKFGRIDYLQLHISKNHTNEKPFKCYICEKSYNQNQCLKAHLRTHSNEKPHICNICNKAFSHISNMTRHIRTVHCEEKLHKCDICNKTFNTSIALKRHKRVHQTELPVSCQVCNRTYRDQSVLLHHQKWNCQKPKRLKCPICRKKQANLSAHIRYVHTQPDYKPYKCSMCSSTFRIISRLNEHVDVIHKKIKRFKCGNCEKSFLYKQYLLKHMLMC